MGGWQGIRRKVILDAALDEYDSANPNTPDGYRIARNFEEGIESAVDMGKGATAQHGFTAWEARAHRIAAPAAPGRRIPP